MSRQLEIKDQQIADSSATPASTKLATEGPSQNLRWVVRELLKGVGIGMASLVVALPAASCWLEARLSSGNGFFIFWAQSLAHVPGTPGKYLRKCFYHLTLESCSLSSDIGFMSCFHDRRAEVGHRVYVGSSASIGFAVLNEGCLIGSRVSILSGGNQHEIGPDGKLTHFDRASAIRVRIGRETWIGEGAILMADVGNQCIVAAGSVVSGPIPDGSVIGGNPARFIRKSV